LGGEQQQLTGHQGCFGGWADPLELGHSEELQQAEVHHPTKCCSEPPAPEAHHQEAKTAHTKATQQAFAQGA